MPPGMDGNMDQSKMMEMIKGLGDLMGPGGLGGLGALGGLAGLAGAMGGGADKGMGGGETSEAIGQGMPEMQ